MTTPRDYPAHEPMRPRARGALSSVVDRTIAEVGALVGYAVRADGLACPACREPVRGPHDRRPSAGLTATGRGWHCHRCGVRGTSMTLAAYALLGRVPGRGDSAGWRALSVAIEEAGAPVDLPPAAPVVRAVLRPPLAEVDAVWGACGPPDRAVAEWLRSRGLDPVALSRRDLVRSLPVGYVGPAWMPHDASERRAVLAARDATGAVRSLRFRATGTARPKAAPPSGRADARTGGAAYAVGGLVLACPLAAGMLAGIARPDRVVVCEGEPDWLTLCQTMPDRAVIGVWSGSWTAEIAARVPEGAEVLIAVHHDDAGHKYAATVRGTLERRCDVTRTATGPGDENDRHRRRLTEAV